MVDGKCLEEPENELIEDGTKRMRKKEIPTTREGGVN